MDCAIEISSPTAASGCPEPLAEQTSLEKNIYLQQEKIPKEIPLKSPGWFQKFGRVIAPFIPLSLGSPLSIAALFEDETRVANLLQQGYRDNVTNCFSGTALEFASIDENITILRLLKPYTDLDSQTKAMRWAASANSIQIMLELISWGVDLNAQDAEGNTPLHTLAISGFGHQVAILSRYGGDPTIHNHKGKTAEQLKIRGLFRRYVRDAFILTTIAVIQTLVLLVLMVPSLLQTLQKIAALRGQMTPKELNQMRQINPWFRFCENLLIAKMIYRQSFLPTH